jgi:serine/threonine protein kinase
MALRGEKLEKPTYEILRSLKGGKSGPVHMADHKVFGRPCVQKTYSTFGLEDAAAYREPRALHKIKHPHVVEILEAQYDPDVEDAITIVTVYCEGGSIADAFDENYRFSIHQALRLTTHALDALAHVHTEHRLIHRDPKPGNVFLDASRETAYLGDFGSAAEIEDDCMVAGIEGSPLYTAPEGGPPSGRIAVSGDVYGIGMTLFEMLNGPFPYAAIDPQVVDRRLTRGQRALPESAFVFAPHIPEPLRRVVRKAVRPRPGDRFSTPGEFITAIGRLQCIDWKHVEGDEPGGGIWQGTWPPHRALSSRRRYRVVARTLKRGRESGKRRLEAYQAPSLRSNFSRFGVEDETVEPDDMGAIERFFKAVQDKAAQRAPAR